MKLAKIVTGAKAFSSWLVILWSSLHSVVLIFQPQEVKRIMLHTLVLGVGAWRRKGGMGIQSTEADDKNQLQTGKIFISFPCNFFLQRMLWNWFFCPLHLLTFAYMVQCQAASRKALGRFWFPACRRVQRPLRVAQISEEGGGEWWSQGARGAYVWWWYTVIEHSHWVFFSHCFF